MAIQSISLWTGQYLNYFYRQLGRDVERLTRPLDTGQHGYEDTPLLETIERIKRFVRLPFLLPLTLLSAPFSCSCFAIASALQNGRLEIIDNEAARPSIALRKITLLSLNVCFQEGFSAPIEGGVVPPFDPVARFPSRVAAVAYWISRQNPAPDIFLGQEFSDLSAQNAFVTEMQKYGYRFFILDRAPHAILYNSGLLVASKYKLTDISVIPFPIQDRYLGGKSAQKGAIRFSLHDQEDNFLLRILNTHLNAHYGPGADEARKRQIKNHILPHLVNLDIPTVLLGDLNFDTSDAALKREAGLERYRNLCEGRITCTNEGMIHLRNRRMPLVEEKIDGVIINRDDLTAELHFIKKVQVERALLSDHFAVNAAITLKK